VLFVENDGNQYIDFVLALRSLDLEDESETSLALLDRRKLCESSSDDSIAWKNEFL
jgi:hypothetical protein